MNTDTGSKKSPTKLIPLLITLGVVIIIAISTSTLNNNSRTYTPIAKLDILPKLQKPNIATTSLLFMGDMMFDRGVRAQERKVGFDSMFVDFTKEFSEPFDITIANLEGPITSYPSKLIGSDGKGIPGFSFTFPTSTANALKRSGIDIVSLANNHTDNFGPEGLRQTVKWLDAEGVQYFGTPTNDITNGAVAPLSKRVCTEKTNVCISLIGYHEFTFENDQAIINAIKDARVNSDIVIVVPHWGIEYEHSPRQKQINLAHSWIDAGADYVIGSHPHVIQSFEMYKDKPIFYSLGNYMFDQYFSYHTTHSLAVGLILTQNLDVSKEVKLSEIKLYPIDNTNIKTRATSPADTEKMLTKLFEVSSSLPLNIRDQILSGTIIF